MAGHGTLEALNFYHMAGRNATRADSTDSTGPTAP
jgi:hypothetical protein